MSKICIISLGWLGLALYKELELQRVDVIGSYATTPKGLKGEFQFDINSSSIPEAIKNSDIIVLSLPPSSIKDEEIFIHFLKLMTKAHLIFISSTSVYGEQGVVDENTGPKPETKNGKRLLKWEEFIIKNFKKYHIIRSAGQYGPNRHPANYLSGKVDIKGENSPVNLISQFDLINIIKQALVLPDSLVINAVNTNHPAKADFYTHVCNERNLAPPQFINKENKTKVVKTIHSQFTVNTSLYKGIL